MMKTSVSWRFIASGKLSRQPILNEGRCYKTLLVTLKAGAAISVVVNNAFDTIYDGTVGKIIDKAVGNSTKTIDNAVKKAKKVVDKVGNAVSGFFSGLGSAFN